MNHEISECRSPNESVDEQEHSFTCYKCNQRFENQKKLENHRQNHECGYQSQQQSVSPQFVCKSCNHKFDTTDELMKHVKAEHAHIYECCVCKKQFKQKVHLESHMSQHTGIKNFSCPLCNKAFARKDTMEVHLRVHKNDRMFECEVCGARFRQKAHLTRHMNVHLERINVQCELCGKQFYRMDQYNNHMRKQHMNSDL